MKYSEFIEGIKCSLEEIPELKGREDTDDDPDFRRWRHQLTSLIEAIEKMGYDVNCRVSKRAFDAMGYEVYKKDRIKAYDRDLADTSNELETILDYYARFGDPKKTERTSIKSDCSQNELDYPKVVTLKWLINHAPISIWVKYLGTLLAAFLLGVAFSGSGYYDYFTSVWANKTKVESEK